MLGTDFKYLKQIFKTRTIIVENFNKFKLALVQTDWSIFENINDTNLGYKVL